MPFPLIPIISAVAPLIGGLFAGKKTEKKAKEASAGARLPDLMPLIQALISQQQNQSQQNYSMQQQQFQSNQPLQDAIRKMAMGMMPAMYQSQSPMRQPPMAQPTPQPLPNPFSPPSQPKRRNPDSPRDRY